MLQKCQAYLIGKTPTQIAELRRVAQRAGFTNCADLLTGEGTIDANCPVRYFFVHFRVADEEILSTMAAVRGSTDDNTRFSPFVMIIDDCDYEIILKYIRYGFDDVISLPEKADILAHRIEALLRTEHTYFETRTYFGPDRRRLEISPDIGDRRNSSGGKHTRYRFTRDPEAGILIMQRLHAA
jgi:PleD family two-component response regulator